MFPVRCPQRMLHAFKVQSVLLSVTLLIPVLSLIPGNAAAGLDPSLLPRNNKSPKSGSTTTESVTINAPKNAEPAAAVEKPKTESAKPKTPAVKVKVDDGLKFQSEDKAYSYQIGGRINVDARSFTYPSDTLFTGSESTKQLFEMRRLRLDVKATIGKYVKLKFSEDFAANSTSDKPETKEAWISYGYFSAGNVMVGQVQYPYSSEDSGSSKYYEFLEQSSICAALASGEDRGIMLVGNRSDDRYHYEIGMFNGAGANLADNNDSLDTAVRFVLNPADPEEEQKYWIGVSYSTGKQTVSKDLNDTLSLRTESRSKKKFFSATLEPLREFTKTRQGVDVTYLTGPTTVKGEYFRGDYKFEGSAALQGGYIMAGHFITGEQRAVENGVFEKQKVEEPYDPEGDGRGAIEFTLRYSFFHADPKFFDNDSLYTGWAGVSTSKYVNAGYSWTYGVNWYPDTMSRIQLNYIQSFAAKEMIKSFNDVIGMSGKAAETAILVRFAQEF